jgi:hypothetical protein
MSTSSSIFESKIWPPPPVFSNIQARLNVIINPMQVCDERGQVLQTGKYTQLLISNR